VNPTPQVHVYDPGGLNPSQTPLPFCLQRSPSFEAHSSVSEQRIHNTNVTDDASQWLGTKYTHSEELLMTNTMRTNMILYSLEQCITAEIPINSKLK